MLKNRGMSIYMRDVYACGPKTVPVKRTFLNIAIVGWGGVGWGGVGGHVNVPCTSYMRDVYVYMIIWLYVDVDVWVPYRNGQLHPWPHRCLPWLFDPSIIFGVWGSRYIETHLFTNQNMGIVWATLVCGFNHIILFHPGAEVGRSMPQYCSHFFILHPLSPFSCWVWREISEHLRFPLGFGSNFHPIGFLVYWVIAFRNGHHAVVKT